jgi:hypothetical protein
LPFKKFFLLHNIIPLAVAEVPGREFEVRKVGRMVRVDPGCKGHGKNILILHNIFSLPGEGNVNVDPFGASAYFQER